MEEELDLEDMLDAPTVYRPEDILLNNDQYCQAILDSEYFEEYIRTLADRNPYYLRIGIAIKSGRFIKDLLRTAEAANESFNSQLRSEGTDFETYKREHECECLIFRDNFFRQFEMPDERQTIPLWKIKALVGQLSEQQLQRYHDKTHPMDADETNDYIQRIRGFVDLMGWRHIHQQDENWQEPDLEDA